jgi:PAS domain S-box-containing protein
MSKVEVQVSVSGQGLPPSADGVEPAATEAEVRSQLEHYVSLVEHAPDAIVVLDVAEGRFISVNPAAEKLFGLPRRELLTLGLVELSPLTQPDGRPSATAAAEYIARAVAGESPRFAWTYLRADGSTVACEMTLLGLPSDGNARVRGSILDITDRLEAVSARRAAADAQSAQATAEAGAARLQAMVAGLNAIVWECDAATWRFRYINERAEELLGYPVAEWLADEPLWTSIIEPADRDRALRAVARRDRRRRRLRAGLPGPGPRRTAGVAAADGARRPRSTRDHDSARGGHRHHRAQAPGAGVDAARLRGQRAGRTEHRGATAHRGDRPVGR